MIKKTKKGFAVLLAVLMILSSVPVVNVFAWYEDTLTFSDIGSAANIHSTYYSAKLTSPNYPGDFVAFYLDGVNKNREITVPQGKNFSIELNCGKWVAEGYDVTRGAAWHYGGNNGTTITANDYASSGDSDTKWYALYNESNANYTVRDNVADTVTGTLLGVGKSGMTLRSNSEGKTNVANGIFNFTPQSFPQLNTPGIYKVRLAPTIIFSDWNGYWRAQRGWGRFDYDTSQITSRTIEITVKVEGTYTFETVAGITQTVSATSYLEALNKVTLSNTTQYVAHSYNFEHDRIVYKWPTSYSGDTQKSEQRELSHTVVQGTGNDRNGSDYMMICSDGLAGNTTLGLMTFDISNISADVSNATLKLKYRKTDNAPYLDETLNIVDVPTNKNLVDQKYTTINSSEYLNGYLVESNYRTQNAYKRILQVFNVTEDNVIGTVQNSELTQSSTYMTKDIPVSEAIKRAKARTSNNDKLYLLFMIPTSGSNGRVPWSDIRVGAEGQSYIEYSNSGNVKEIVNYTAIAPCTKNITSSTAATCTTGGVVNYECNLCHNTLTESTSALGHNFTLRLRNETSGDGRNTIKFSDCINGDIRYLVCSNCGLMSEGIDENATWVDTPRGQHQVGAWDRVEPTCVDNGSKTGFCLECTQTVTEVIPATGIHTWTTRVELPQDSQKLDGRYNVVTYCSVCNDSAIETTVSEKLESQKLVSDFGLDITYPVKKNNTGSQPITYIGVVTNEANLPTLDEVDNYNDSKYTAIEQGGTTVAGQYGSITVKQNGEVTYAQKNMKMNGNDTFWLIANVGGKVTYEELTFIPATTIYYEDNYNNNNSDGITYTDGIDVRGHGTWSVDGTSAVLTQAADLVGDESANVYGYDGAYAQLNGYSGGSAHKVSVSEDNHTQWPSASFTFTGTGFDIVSLTSNQSGVFYVKATNGSTTKTKIIDTYHGYTYGQVYRNANGEATLEANGNTPMYKSVSTVIKDDKEVENFQKMTATPTYYDENGKVVKENTGNLEPAYAFGWVKDADTSEFKAGYQVPVIRLADLDYGTWTVTVEARYSKVFGHSQTDDAGEPYYDLYFDGVRIYNPAGKGDSLNEVVKDAYVLDGEANSTLTKVKDLVVGSETLTDDAKEGAILIDRLSSVPGSQLPEYLNAGPNNELYLDKDNSVSFQLKATAKPKDVQIGLKMAKQGNGGANPVLSVNGGYNQAVATATEMNYSLEKFFGIDLNWREENGGWVTDTIVIQNTADVEGATLSLTNIKWTFENGASAPVLRSRSARAVTPAENSGTIQVLKSTRADALKMLALNSADLSIDKNQVKTEAENGKVTIKLQTSADVKQLAVKDGNGNPANVESITAVPVSEGKTEWTVIINQTEAGTYTYSVTALADESHAGEPIEVTVTVPAQSTEPGEQNPPKENFIQKLIRIFKSFIERICALFGMSK